MKGQSFVLAVVVAVLGAATVYELDQFRVEITADRAEISADRAQLAAALAQLEGTEKRLPQTAHDTAHGAAQGAVQGANDAVQGIAKAELDPQTHIDRAVDTTQKAVAAAVNQANPVTQVQQLGKIFGIH